MPDLKKCPFCYKRQAEPYKLINEDMWSVSCCSCGSSCGVFENKDRAILEWNCRAKLEEVAPPTSNNSAYTKCKIETEIKRLKEDTQGYYITRISTLEWVLQHFA